MRKIFFSHDSSDQVSAPEQMSRQLQAALRGRTRMRERIWMQSKCW
jgi:hypothetical protein